MICDDVPSKSTSRRGASRRPPSRVQRPPSLDPCAGSTAAGARRTPASPAAARPPPLRSVAWRPATRAAARAATRSPRSSLHALPACFTRYACNSPATSSTRSRGPALLIVSSASSWLFGNTRALRRASAAPPVTVSAAVGCNRRCAPEFTRAGTRVLRVGTPDTSWTHSLRGPATSNCPAVRSNYLAVTSNFLAARSHDPAVRCAVLRVRCLVPSDR